MSFLGYKFKILKASQVPFDFLPIGEIAIYVPDGDVDTAARIAESLLISGGLSGKFKMEADGNAGTILEFGADIAYNIDFADTNVLVDAARRVQSDIAFNEPGVDCNIYVFGRRYIEAVIQVVHRFDDVDLKVDAVNGFGGGIAMPEPKQEAAVVFDGVRSFGSSASFRVVVVATQHQLGAVHIESEATVPSPKVVLVGRTLDRLNINAELSGKVAMEAAFGMLGETILADFDDSTLADMDGKTLADLRFKTLI